MLNRLPLEILYMVAHAVNCSTELSKLSRVNKYLHQTLVPFLYETAVIKSNETFLDLLEFTPAKTWFRQDGSKTLFNSLEFVKHLQLVAPIHEKLQKRCYYYDGYIKHPRTREHWTAILDSHIIGLDSLSSSFENLLFHLPEQSLQSFSWHLGCCVPSSILGIDGWLPSKHSGIRALSLITDGTCYTKDPEDSGIPKLAQLRSFSWRGFGEYDQYQHRLIQQSLALNSAHLERLELEPTVRFERAVGIDELLDIQSDGPEVGMDEHAAAVAYPKGHSLVAETLPTKLAVLRHLSLFGIYLNPYDQMMSAINFHQLQSLKLVHCLDTSELLSGMSSSGKRINLRSFEWVSDDVPASHISEFLKSFEGLEELYISTPRSSLSLNDMIFPHRATMKRLVFHVRAIDDLDRLLDWLGRTDARELESLDNIFRLIPLECIGCHLRHSHLRQALGSSLAATTVKLIHFRIIVDREGNFRPYHELCEGKNTCTTNSANNPDSSKKCKAARCTSCLKDFADWAFGPTGLPNLMAVAFGDFSNGERFACSQVFLVRYLTPSTNLYRIVGHGMHDHVIERISGAREMLSACPIEPTIIYDMDDDDSDTVTDWSVFYREDSADGADNSSEGDD